MSRPARRTFPRLVALYALSTLGLAVLLYSVYGERQRAPLQAGQPSAQTYIAPVDIDVIDRVATERQRQAARAQIVTVFTSEPRLQQLVLSSIAAAGLPEAVQDLLVRAYRDPQGVTPEELDGLVATATGLAAQERQREVRLILDRRLLATSVPNSRLTEAARDAAAAATQPVMQSLQAGRPILSEGDVITEDHLRVLQSVGLYSPRYAQLTQTFWIVLGCLSLAALLSMPLWFAARRLHGRLTLAQLGFLVSLTLLVLTAQRLALLVSPAFLFVMLVPLVVSVLISDETALVWGVWLGIVTALLVPSAPLYTLVAAVAGAVAASLLASSLPSRTSLLMAGVVGGLVGATGLAVMTLAVGGYTPWALLVSVLIVIAGGILAGIVGLGLLPLAESTFAFVTDFRLLELSSPTTPLLQKLLLEAPGSYQHSLIISNLVEQAVKNIGGNSLLARVGALYHDVGKLRRPHFYTENQFSSENPHDKISPHLSYLIIVSHVRDGVELLHSYGIPRAIEPFISEHHGTTVLTYFYKRALEDQTGLEELNFRYPGPRPRSKETAVLMLADAVESASRSLVEPTQGSIRALIERLVEQRLQDGQLSDSTLNFHDLEVIKSTFERMLTAVLHRRVSYPTPEEVRGVRKGGGAGGGTQQHGGDPRRNEPLPAR
ncbi:MAG: HDIG domain-containing metalloprotein [Trueperaceae bacterium]